MTINHTSADTQALNLTITNPLSCFIRSEGFTIKDASELHVNESAKTRYLENHTINSFNRLHDSLCDGDCGVYAANDGKFYTVIYSASPFEPLIWTEITRG